VLDETIVTVYEADDNLPDGDEAVTLADVNADVPDGDEAASLADVEHDVVTDVDETVLLANEADDDVAERE
jgi:hypothetical protein